MIYDDVTGLGFGNAKGLNAYYHKNKKHIKKVLANERRSYNAYYHSAYYRMQSSPAYQKAYIENLRALYDSISRANYPPKPRPKPHKSFWGKIGHGISSRANFVGHEVNDHVVKHWRGIAQTALILGATIAGAACVLASGGICAGVIAGYELGTVAATASGYLLTGGMGAISGAGAYGLGGGDHDTEGYLKAGVWGAAGNVGMGYVSKVVGRAAAGLRFQGTFTSILKRVFTRGRYWKP
jgi:hypothetical protein